MENEKIEPAIRFEGFTDAWELRRLSELFLRGGSGGTPRSTNKAYYNGEIPFLGISDISNSNGFIDRTDKYITEEGLNNSSAWVVPAGSISLAMYASVGKLAILNTDVATSQAFYNMVFDDDNLRDYVYQRLNKANEFREWTKLISTGTQANLNADKVKNFEISTPTNRGELSKISKFFMDLDNLVTLHQRKLDKTKELKKTMLSKMFPKNGASKPELRFSGFTDAWELRKLGDVTKRVRGNDGRMDLPTLTISAGSGWLDQRDRFSGNIAGNEQKNYTLLRKGELSYNHGNSKLAKYGTVFELKTFNEALVPRVYHSFKTTSQASSLFIEYMFASKKPDRELGKLISSGARMDGLLNISYDSFMGIVITLSSVNEQQQIGNFFQSLDNLITLHQRELEQLKIMKKTLLKHMFV